MANTVRVSVNKEGLSRKIQNIVNKSVTTEVLKEIGETLVRMNRKNIRTGKEGDGSAFPPLSRGWMDQRKVLAKYNPIHLAYGPERSNASFTGQLVDGLTYEIDERNKSVTIQFDKNDRDRYLDKNGKEIGKIQTNEEVAGYFADRGIKLIGFNQEMKLRIDFILNSAIRRLLNLKP